MIHQISSIIVTAESTPSGQTLIHQILWITRIPNKAVCHSATRANALAMGNYNRNDKKRALYLAREPLSLDMIPRPPSCSGLRMTLKGSYQAAICPAGIQIG